VADKKISALTAATTPLVGTEVLPVVQSGSTVKVAVSDLTAARAVSGASFTASTGNVVIGTTAKGITTGSAIPLGLGVNNTVDAMTIDASKNVGIGTAPDSKLHVASPGLGSLRIAYSGLSINYYDANAHFFRGESGPDLLTLTLAGVGVNEGSPDYRLDVNGTFGFTPGSSVTPVDNGDVVFEFTNNTTLTVKAKGSDGVVRSATITLT